MLRSLLKNTAARTAAVLINRVGAAIFWLVVARELGASALGVLAFAISLFSFFYTLSTLGLGAVVVREVARQRAAASDYFGHVLLLGLLSSFAAALCLFVTVYIVNPAADTVFASILVAVAMFPASVFYWSKSLLTAVEKMEYISIAQTLENIFKIVFGTGAIWLGADIRTVVIIWVASKFLLGGTGFLFAVRTVAWPNFQWKSHIIRHLIRLAPSFSLITLFNSFFWSVTVVLLTHYAGEKQAGLFSAAYKLVDVCVAVALAYGQAIFPITSRHIKHQVQKIQALYSHSLKYISLLTLAVAAGTSVLAPQIIRFVYGEDMLGAEPLLRLLIWMIVPFALVPMLASSLVSHDLQNRDLRANIFAAMSIVAFNLVFIPAYGAFGAAISLLLACVVFMGVELFFVNRKLFTIPFPIELVKVIPGLLLMAIALYYCRHVHIILTVWIGALVYAVYLWISGIVKKQDIVIIKNVRTAS